MSLDQLIVKGDQRNKLLSGILLHVGEILDVEIGRPVPEDSTTFHLEIKRSHDERLLDHLNFAKSISLDSFPNHTAEVRA